MTGASKRTISLSLLAVAAVTALAMRTSSDSGNVEKTARRVPRPIGSGDALADRSAREGLDDRSQGMVAPWPWKISVRQWRAILAATYSEIVQDRMMAVAGGVVFFILLAIFPAITTFVSLYALFADPATIHTQLARMAGILPTDAFDLLKGEVERIAAKGTGTLGFASVGGLLFAVWSANSGMKAIFDALNVAYDKREKRSFVYLNSIALVFTLGAMIFLLLAIGAVVVVPLVLGQIGLQDFGGILISVLRWPALFILVTAALSVLYGYGPSSRVAKWHWMTTGSLAATLLWLLVGGLFSWYLARFADYSATYGTLGAAIGLMMWLWLSFLVILAGAELDKEVAHEFANDAVERQRSREMNARN